MMILLSFFSNLEMVFNILKDIGEKLTTENKFYIFISYSLIGYNSIIENDKLQR